MKVYTVVVLENNQMFRGVAAECAQEDLDALSELVENVLAAPESEGGHLSMATDDGSWCCFPARRILTAGYVKVPEVEADI
jgi:hypothetical protein